MIIVITLYSFLYDLVLKSTTTLLNCGLRSAHNVLCVRSTPRRLHGWALLADKGLIALYVLSSVGFRKGRYRVFHKL